MRSGVVFSIVVAVIIAASGMTYLAFPPRPMAFSQNSTGQSQASSTGQNRASSWEVVKTSLTVYYGTACIPVEASYLSCPTMDTANHSPSQSNVDLIRYQGSYYYAVNFTYSLNGQPITRTIWFTNSTVFCMSPQEPGSGYELCPTGPS
jgi:hypothetical protein